MANKTATKVKAPVDFSNFDGFCNYVKTHIGEASDEVLRAWWDSWEPVPSEKTTKSKAK